MTFCRVDILIMWKGIQITNSTNQKETLQGIQENWKGNQWEWWNKIRKNLPKQTVPSSNDEKGLQILSNNQKIVKKILLKNIMMLAESKESLRNQEILWRHQMI